MPAGRDEALVEVQCHQAVADWIEEVLARLRKMGEPVVYPIVTGPCLEGRVLMLQRADDVAAWDRMGPGFVAAGILRKAPREVFLGDVERVFMEATVAGFPALFLTTPALRAAAEDVIQRCRLSTRRPAR
ncbi:MAG: hypothetical protein QOE90_3312 [Thermoplasmata archaeon]|jgi:hypothetical protein|nr:hypothetical protein [Thermoplasmata archaeon]